MNWDETLAGGLDLAFNESDVRGLLFSSEQNEARLLVEVLSLPAEGPIDPDPRRVVVLSGVYSIEALLRTDRIAEKPYGPAQPLADLDAVERIFETASWAHSMYGWKFVDTEHFRNDWPVEPSLTIQVRPKGDFPVHSLYWFTECGVPQDDASWASCFEGVIYFDALGIERADGAVVAVADFIEDSRRWWAAFNAHDERLSVANQRGAGSSARRWRPDAGSAFVMVPGAP